MITIKTFLFNLQSFFFFFLEEPSTLIRTAHTPQTWKKRAGVGEGAPGTAVQSLKFHRGEGERKVGPAVRAACPLVPQGVPGRPPSSPGILVTMLLKATDTQVPS